MIRAVLLAALLLTISMAAEAACPGVTLTGKDAAGATQTFCYGGASGAFVPQANPTDATGNPLSATLGATAPASALQIGLKTSGGLTETWPLGPTDTLPQISADNLTLAQGSSTNGQKGSLIFCAVPTSSASSYATATSNPINCTPVGNLRVSLQDIGGVPFTGALPVGPGQIAPAQTNNTQWGGWPVKVAPGKPGEPLVAIDGPVQVVPQAVPPTIQLTAIPKVTAGSYSSGQCTGGFISIPVPVGPQSVLVTGVRVTSISGVAATYTVYVFDAQPKLSVCTDNSTFTLNDSDLLVGTPVSVILAAPTGATPAMADATWTPPRGFQLGPNRQIWLALVAGATQSPGSVTDIHLSISLVGVN